MSTKISKILTQLMSEQKIKTTELARKINIPQPTLHRIVTGFCEHPHSATLKPIANYFSLSIDQLKGIEPIPSIDSAQKIPIMDWNTISRWLNSKLQIESEYTLITDAKLSKKGFAVKVNDVSMDPIFPVNTILFVDPLRVVKDRNYIIAQLENYSLPIFRQIIMDGESYYLKSLNPDLDKYKMRLMSQKDKILGVVVQTKRDFID